MKNRKTRDQTELVYMTSFGKGISDIWIEDTIEGQRVTTSLQLRLDDHRTTFKMKLRLYRLVFIFYVMAAYRAVLKKSKNSTRDSR